MVEIFMRASIEHEAGIEQGNLLEDIKKFNSRTRPQNDDKKKKNKLFLKTCVNVLKEVKYFLMTLLVKSF